jgi:Collagen triple helix repeat (20 copies)
MSTLFDASLGVESRLAKLESYLTDQRFHTESRRGPEGKPGPQGEVGPAGPPADNAAVVELVRKQLQKDFEEFVEKVEGEIVMAKAAIRGLIIDELRISGAIDAEGQAIPGPAGAQGKPGNNGKDGVDGKHGLPGKDGRDGKDGAPGVPGKDGVPGRDGVDGKPGKDGAVGPSGEKGDPGLMTREAVAAVVLDMAKRGSLPSAIHAANQPAGVSKEDLADLIRELKVHQPAPQKPKGFWARLLGR